MDDWFAALTARHALPAASAEELARRGFVVLPGPVASNAMPRLQAAYDAAVAAADPLDVGAGRTTTRVNDFVNRGPEFDDVYVWPPALDACCREIGRPFRLGVMHARSLRDGAPAQELQADVPRGSDAWPMVGLVFMVDAFTAENGATRFVPGSHRWPRSPADGVDDEQQVRLEEVSACGSAGSAILFDASTWHGHGANTSGASRRSLQVTFIPRDGKPATDFAGRMRPETLARISSVARYVIGVSSTADASST